MSSYTVNARSRNVSTGASATVYDVISISDRENSTGTEPFSQITVREPGLFSGFYTKVISNNRGQSTIRFRKNGGNGNQVVTIPASTTGEFEDSSNVDSVVAGDEANMLLSTGSGGTTFTAPVNSVRFLGSTGTYAFYASLFSSLSAASTTSYNQIGGAAQFGAVEADRQITIKGAVTAAHLHTYVFTNGRSTSTTLRTRINGSNGNGVITIGSGVTGYLEDTSNTDALAVDDLFNLSITTGTGSGTLNVNQGVGLSSSVNQQHFMAAALTTSTVNAGLTRYFSVLGRAEAVTTESDIAVNARIPAIFSNLEMYVSANTVTADSTLRLRKNAGAGNQVVTITASTTGWFEDASNVDQVGPTDEINFSLVTGGTGTSLSLTIIAMLAEEHITVAGWHPLMYGRGRTATSVVPSGMQ